MYTSVTIPNSVISIGDWAFKDCSGLTSVTIGSSVTIIGDWAFSDCSGLTSVTIPNSVTSIGDYAFMECRVLTEVTIGNYVTSIGEYAFFGCTGMTSVTIGNSVTSIGSRAFENCYGLTEVTIPNSVTSIGKYAFCDCRGLTSINIPNSVTSIGECAFWGCNGIAEPLYNANCFAYFPQNYDIDDYAIPEGIKQIAGLAFYECRNLSSVTIPKSVTNIGPYTFYECENLKTINYNAKNCVLFGRYDYYDHGYYAAINSPFSVLNLGDSVEFISDSAFYGCNSITSIYSYAENPPAIQPHTFESSISDIPVFVKCGEAEEYRSAENWSNFTNIQGSKYMLYAESDNSQMGTATVTQAPDCTDGTATIKATPQNGYHFVRWNDGNTDNPRTVVVTNDTTFIASFEDENGVEENSIETKISLYPNPVGNTLYISAEATISEIEIVNVMGQVVKRMEVNSDKAVCDVEDLKAGVYVVRINTEGSVVSQRKFVKE